MATVFNPEYIVMAHESFVFFMVTGLIAEVLFLLFFIYRAVKRDEHS